MIMETQQESDTRSNLATCSSLAFTQRPATISSRRGLIGNQSWDGNNSRPHQARGGQTDSCNSQRDRKRPKMGDWGYAEAGSTPARRTLSTPLLPSAAIFSQNSRTNGFRWPQQPCRKCMGQRVFFRAFPLPAGWVPCECGTGERKNSEKKTER